jgi:hypothetical protein
MNNSLPKIQNDTAYYQRNSSLDDSTKRENPSFVKSQGEQQLLESFLTVDKMSAMKQSNVNQSIRKKESQGCTSVGNEPIWTLTDDDDDGDGTQSLTLNSPTDATDVQYPLF